MSSKSQAQILFVMAGLSFCVGAAHARPLPARPTQAQHPGSNNYPYAQVTEIQETVDGRTGVLFLPRSGPALNRPFPTLAWGHGFMALKLFYRESFLHLARKGVAVLDVPYDTGAGDRDFDRMARDYNHFVAAVVARHPGVLDPHSVVFSGHSNGATVASMAAGLPVLERKIEAANLIAFEIAGKHVAYLHALNPHLPCTLVVGEDDHDDPVDFSKKVFSEMACKKQLIIMKTYGDEFDHKVTTNHVAVQTFTWLGPNTSVLHYYGFWKFMIGAAFDASAGGHATNPWLYGPEASSTGDDELKNTILH